MNGRKISRRETILTAAGVLLAPTVSLAVTNDTLWRIGTRIIAEHGVTAARSLVHTEQQRLTEIDGGGPQALRAACAADYRAGRTITISGVQLARIEGARAARAALCA